MSASLNWLNDARGGSHRKSLERDFTMMKTRNFFDHYTVSKSENFKKVLELGVCQGGAVAQHAEAKVLTSRARHERISPPL
jgi:hypothetical protein